ncbi:MAG: lipid II flippase MurJ [Cyanobium sp. MAG06]|nr:lipid II flippase MurJ [Cyanobium sp. MAG06]
MNYIYKLIDKLRSDKIFRNSIVISGFMIFGQLLSIYRERVLANYVGIGAELDIYNTAFRVPDIIMTILLSVVATGIIVPYLSAEYNSQVTEDRDKYNSKFNNSLILFLIIIFILIIFTFTFMPYIMRLLTRDIVTGADFEQLILLSKILLIQPLFLGLSILFSSLGQIRDKFILSSLSPIIYNFGIIFGIIFLYKDHGLLGIIIGVVVGAMGHFILQLFHLRKNPIHIHLKHFNKNYIIKHFRLAVPRSGSLLLTEVKNTLFNFILLSVGAGALSIYRLINNIINIPPSIISGGVGTSSLPTLSKYYNDNKYEEHNKLFLNSIYKVLLIVCPLTIILYIYARDIIGFIYGYKINNINEMVSFMQAVILQVIVFSITVQFTNYFSSMKLQGLIFKANLIGTVLIFIHF